MFAKHVSEITYSDILDLVNVRKEREGYHLDFKRDVGHPDKAKKELAKDLSAFANSTGGYLILGIDKDYNIVGTETLVQNKPIDEWINQITSSNIDPPIFYFDPKIIEIPESNKVIVVIHVPESNNKPHIVTEWNNYFTRINDVSKSSTHYQIRDMFEFSKRSNAEFDEFLSKRNLLSEDHFDFGINNNSNKLFSEVPAKTGQEKPIILFSLIPRILDDKINLPFEQFDIWLNSNSSGYEPFKSFALYYTQNYDLKLDGVILKQTQNKELTSYFEILNNGYVEAGFSASLTFPFTDKSSGVQAVAIYLTSIIGYELLLLRFAQRFYALAKYSNEVLIQISFRNVLDFKLYGFHDNFNDLSLYETGNVKNKHHTNFKLTYRFNPRTLSDAEILKIGKQHSEKLCRAFGLYKDYCFVNDSISVSSMRHFRL